MKKTVRRTKKYHAHDENNTAKAGDVVRIEECRPMSRSKTWMFGRDTGNFQGVYERDSVADAEA